MIGAPFGGYKSSGFGRTVSAESILDYTQVKSVIIDGRAERVEVSLAGKVALVTGAGPNIGSGDRAGPRPLRRQGGLQRPLRGGRRRVRAPDRAPRRRGDGDPRRHHRRGVVNGYIGEVLDRWGRIDILINNAAILGGRGVLEESLEFFNRAIEVAGAGTFLNTKHAAIAMIERDIRGSIVNVLSSNAWQGAPG